MKYLLIILCFTTLLSCKKDEDPEPVKDYTSSVVGTYIGQETYYDTDNSTVLNSSASKTLTIAKVGENKVQISTFFSNAQPYFTLSDAGNGNIRVAPDSPNQAEGGTGMNIYITSGSNLKLNFKSAINKYSYYDGIKQ